MTLPVLLLLAALMPAAQDTPPAATTASETQESAPAEDTAAPAEPARRSTPAVAETGDPVASGLTAFRKRRFKQAESHFRRAVESDPQSAAAHFYLGYTIYKMAEPRRANSPGKQEAAQHFAKAYELDPAFKPSWGPRT